jgi:hypothetical protein
MTFIYIALAVAIVLAGLLIGCGAIELLRAFSEGSKPKRVRS